MEFSLSPCPSGGGSSYLQTPVLNGGGQILSELFRVQDRWAQLQLRVKFYLGDQLYEGIKDRWTAVDIVHDVAYSLAETTKFYNFTKK